MNLWHDIKLGDKAPKEFHMIIETPRGSNNKYEIDKENGLIALDRANYSSAPFPFDYGFAPQTLWNDNDALDIVLFSTNPLFPGIMATVRPVGVLEMIDSGESDFKILAVPVDDKRFEHIKDLEDLNQHTVKEYKHFFETYKMLKGKGDVVEIPTISGREKAEEAVLKSVAMYKAKFGK